MSQQIETEVRLLLENGVPPYLNKTEIMQYFNLGRNSVNIMLRNAQRLAGGRYSLLDCVRAMHRKQEVHL